MATGGRKTQLQAIHQISRTIFLADAAVSIGQLVGVLPANCRALRIQVNVEVVFNAGTTNTVSVGTTLAGTDLISAAAAGSLALTTTAVPQAKVLPLVDTPIFVSYAQSGGAATTGQLTVIIEYLAAVG